jgi:hypothetical protein
MMYGAKWAGLFRPNALEAWQFAAYKVQSGLLGMARQLRYFLLKRISSEGATFQRNDDAIEGRTASWCAWRGSEDGACMNPYVRHGGNEPAFSS